MSRVGAVHVLTGAVALNEQKRLEGVAKVDALRDLREAGIADLDANERESPADQPELAATVGPLEHAAVPDEHYDALDAENIGAVWLERATEASGPEGQAVDELLDGSHVIEPDLDADEDVPPSATDSEEALARLRARSPS